MELDAGAIGSAPGILEPSSLPPRPRRPPTHPNASFRTIAANRRWQGYRCRWSILHNRRDPRGLAASEDATFRSGRRAVPRFRDPLPASAPLPARISIWLRFGRLFAFALAGLDRLDPPRRRMVEDMAANVDEDVLAPYLALVVARSDPAVQLPDEDELARLYGSSSPSRVRRLLLIISNAAGWSWCAEDFGGDRSITIPGIAALMEPGETA